MCKPGWHGPACNLAAPAWALLGKLSEQHAQDLSEQARAKRVQVKDLGDVAKVLVDAAAANADAKAKAAALSLQAQTLLNDAAKLEAEAAATADPSSSTAFGGLNTCTPDLNGIQPTGLN